MAYYLCPDRESQRKDIAKISKEVPDSDDARIKQNQALVPYIYEALRELNELGLS